MPYMVILAPQYYQMLLTDICPGKGNDKGKVEGLVEHARRNFLGPVPSFPSFDALNVHLEERCLERLGRQLRGHNETIGQRMERDLEALLPLPAVPYDASDKHVSRVSSLSLVRYPGGLTSEDGLGCF